MKAADIVRTVITGALLLGFLIVFAQEVRSIWGEETPSENEARTYFWTATGVTSSNSKELPYAWLGTEPGAKPGYECVRWVAPPCMQPNRR